MLSLGEAGYSEVTLLGQNVDAYGRDLPGFAPDGSGRRAWTFTDLLRHVHGDHLHLSRICWFQRVSWIHQTIADETRQMPAVWWSKRRHSSSQM